MNNKNYSDICKNHLISLIIKNAENMGWIVEKKSNKLYVLEKKTRKMSRKEKDVEQLLDMIFDVNNFEI